MSIIVIIVLGGVVGYLAARLLGRREGAVMSVIIGVIGSVIGSFVSKLFVGSDQSFLAFSWMGLFWAFIGSLVLVAIMNALSGPRHHTVQ